MNLTQRNGKTIKQISEVKLPEEPNGKDSQGSVSYTHLDVYKRQVIKDDFRLTTNKDRTSNLMTAIQWWIAV